MKYYDETQMAGIRKTLEAEINKWPGVASKGMMGCLCYFRKSKFFAVLVTDGIVITKLDAEDQLALSKMVGAKPFEIGGRASSHWIQQALHEPRDLVPLMPYIRKSYEAASRR